MACTPAGVSRGCKACTGVGSHPDPCGATGAAAFMDVVAAADMAAEAVGVAAVVVVGACAGVGAHPGPPGAPDAAAPVAVEAAAAAAPASVAAVLAAIAAAVWLAGVAAAEVVAAAAAGVGAEGDDAHAAVPARQGPAARSRSRRVP